jgi:hypothetical protein
LILKDGFAIMTTKEEEEAPAWLDQCGSRFQNLWAKHVNFKSICISFGKIYEGLNMFWQNA